VTPFRDRSINDTVEGPAGESSRFEV